jgi:phytoene dehydrogenase-like protein
VTGRAVVVGAGPNGLAAAATLARAGLRVTVLEAEDTFGGGTRTSELTAPGLLHDHCSAVHAMAVGAPSILGLSLGRHGLTWRWAAVDLAHPLDDGTAGVMVRDIEETARSLGPDGNRWLRVFGASSASFGELQDDLMRPILSAIPRHPVLLARLGLLATVPATTLAHAFVTPQAKALFGGVAAHANRPLSDALSSAVGVALICACHRYGWPVAEGGSRAISDGLAAVLRDHGGEILTGRRVVALAELPRADVVMLDLGPGAVARLAGDRLPRRVERAYRRYRHGPGTYKVDVAVRGGVPWTNAACRRAGTVHAIGELVELVEAADQVDRGVMPTRPFVVVGQQALADPSRARGTLQPVSAYAQVPHGYTGDATAAILDQIERFAPLFRERIECLTITSPAGLEASNANYVGGDILTGAGTLFQTVFRPRVSRSPYATGVDGVFICSAATPPGPGAHGMNGWNAAHAALGWLGAAA